MWRDRKHNSLNFSNSFSLYISSYISTSYIPALYLSASISLSITLSPCCNHIAFRLCPRGFFLSPTSVSLLTLSSIPQIPLLCVIFLDCALFRIFIGIHSPTFLLIDTLVILFTKSNILRAVTFIFLTPRDSFSFSLCAFQFLSYPYPWGGSPSLYLSLYLSPGSHWFLYFVRILSLSLSLSLSIYLSIYISLSPLSLSPLLISIYLSFS